MSKFFRGLLGFHAIISIFDDLDKLADGFVVYFVCSIYLLLLYLQY